MKQKITRAISSLIAFTILFVSPFALTAEAQTSTTAPQTARQAQTENLNALKEKAGALLGDKKFTDALPILEKIAVLEPNSADTHFYLGFALLGQSANTADKAARKPLRVRARNEFVKARELGKNEPLVNGLIESLPADGSEAGGFSANEQANDLMEKGEALFTQGKLDDALATYQKALALDPKIYEAALFSGDVYKEKNDFANAEIWYQKAIAIAPNRETAYRYSATPLMLQKKYEAARDRYVEAFIVEPYSKFSASGLGQWAQATSVRLGHPKIDIPVDVGADGKGGATINLDANALLNGDKNGGAAWLLYGGTRAEWRKTKFAKTFPNEKTYRHSLQEEAEALRSVVAFAEADQKKGKTLPPAIAKLKELNDKGLLEAYILLARADNGIAQDHAAYLKQNRDKLRGYVLEYVIHE